MIATLIIMLTALPVLYYYYIMYIVNEKTRYLIGLLAGAWAFLGVLFVIGGVIRFWYFIIFVILIVFVYIFEKVMEYLDPDFEEGDQEEYEIEWPIEVSNITMAVLVLCMILLMYFAFFLVPVSPAKANDFSGFDEDEGKFKSLPNAYKYEYKSTIQRSYVVIITLRMVPVTQGMLESTLDYAKPLVEEYIKDRYNQDATLELRDEGTTEIEDHDAVEQTYDVHWQAIGGQNSATMVLQAFYYHEDMETIVIGYVYRPDYGSDAVSIADNLEL